MAARFYVVCDVYRQGPYKTREDAETVRAQIERIRESHPTLACRSEHRIEQAEETEKGATR
jgi:hypothetical protein